ncbi:MAG: hypothetical protein KAW47_09620, partial [Thermoplasmatales archaeon]|nr:hypothetical protein [Thermoplasmatales archaeon]
NHVYTNIPFVTTLDLEKVIDYLNDHPQVAKINEGCIQLDLGNDIKERINTNYVENFKKIMKIKQDIYLRRK